MLPTIMIFTHLPHVMSIMTVQDLDLTSLDTLKQSVGAFIDEKKKEHQMVLPLPPLPLLDIVYLDEENNLERIEKQVPLPKDINLPDVELNETIPNATASLGYIKPGEYKDELGSKLQLTVFTVRLYTANIDAQNYLSDKDKKAVNDCDYCDTLEKSKEYYKTKWLERVSKLYGKFHEEIIPVYEKWDAFAKELSNWVDGITDVEKVAFKEFNLELVLKLFKKREDFLAYSYQALAKLIDARVNVLKKEKVPKLVTGTGAPGPSDSATKDTTDKDKSETTEGMSKSTIALIVIVVVAVILIAGMVCFYLYKTKVQKHNAQTSEDTIEV